MKSRTDFSTTRSHALPAAPARISEPQVNSARPASRRRRKAAAITGMAKRETTPHAREGNSPQAMPGFVVS